MLLRAVARFVKFVVLIRQPVAQKRSREIGQLIKNNSCYRKRTVVLLTTGVEPMKKKGEMKSFKIRLPEKLIADLEELASADNRSIANFVRNLLEGFVKTIRARASE
jgi:hypothetical protein